MHDALNMMSAVDDRWRNVLELDCTPRGDHCGGQEGRDMAGAAGQGAHRDG